MNIDHTKQRLDFPTSKVSVVLDTDTYNEIDDQFALAYALRSPERIDLEAIYSAPFDNNRSTGPGDGMEKSYEEILRVLDRLDETGRREVYKGSERFLPDSESPIDSPAARNLVERAMARNSKDPPLYVVAIGAITNIASALLLEPRIADRIVVLWLGGHQKGFHAHNEFNLAQDPNAARIVFGCGAPLIWFPCFPVVSHLITTVAELDRDLAGRSQIGTYLTEITRDYSKDHFAWGKVIWDIAPVAWLVNSDWFHSRIIPSPKLAEDLDWIDGASTHPIREVTQVKRNLIFRDVFTKLGR